MASAQIFNCIVCNEPVKPRSRTLGKLEFNSVAKRLCSKTTSLKRNDFTCAANRLLFAAKRLVAKRLCSETTGLRVGEEEVKVLIDAEDLQLPPCYKSELTYFKISIFEGKLSIRIDACLAYNAVRGRTTSTAGIRLHFVRYTRLKQK